jgi:glycosyltransferase involved in cell wall biosynthesis
MKVISKMIYKVFMLPTPSQAALDNSNAINQIVLRLQKILPSYGWEITENESEADIVAVHAGQTTRDIICDIAHCHGLYPTAQFPNTQWHWKANENVIRTLREAKLITVPSDWVAEILRRDMNIEPSIVRWAINRSEWHMGPHKAYTLWNKTRVSAVCDPNPIYYLAQEISDAQFVSTFLPSGKENNPLPNLKVIGRQKFEDMKPIIHDASIYLSTTKETFGIGIVEAMATGSPILGYNWGAIPEIVTHGIDGYLVEPHDLEGLVTGWKWIMRHRRTLSFNARQAAIDEYYSWRRVASQIAGLYDEVLESKNSYSDKADISVIIPNHNYDEWVKLAAISVLKQETDKTVEVIIINDSCDNDQTQTMEKLRNNDYSKNITFAWVNVNFGSVAKTRNHGIELSQGKYILCLDADDQLARPDALEILASALDNDPLLGVAYGKLGIFKDDINDGFTVSSFPDKYNPELQIKGRNQISSCAMFKRQAYDSTGGYRQHLEPAEDAGLWSLMALHGWKGELVTNEVIYYYRMHDKSLSQTVRSQQKPEPKYNELHHAPKTGLYPLASAAPTKTFSHPVFNYDIPEVSIIIPVGKNHKDNVIRAVDSIASQTFNNWECLVINDTGSALDLPQKWAKVVGVGKSKGAGYARNVGVKYSTGKYIVFLDADDKLEPEFLHKTLIHAKTTGKYVYTDWYDRKREVCHAQPYTQEKIFNETSIHAVTVLIKREWVEDVGLFDDTMSAWEDTDLFMKLATKGYCGSYLPEPLFEYDYETGTRRNDGITHKEELKSLLNNRYGAYREGKKMARNCCGKSTKPVPESTPPDKMVEVMIISGPTGSIPIVGGVTKTRYGNRSKGETFYMYASDAKAQPDKFSGIENGATEPKQTIEPDAPNKVHEVKL